MTIGLGEQTGWSLVHLANILGRLGNGEEAWQSLRYLAQSCTGASLLTYHNDHRGMGMTMPMTYGLGAPLQLDANFGYPAAILEMLVYSAPGRLRLLPALPKQWAVGTLRGVQTRCGVTVDLEWDAARLSLRLVALRDTCLRLETPASYGEQESTLHLRAGESHEAIVGG